MSAATETSAAPASATPKVNDVPEVEGFKVSRVLGSSVGDVACNELPWLSLPAPGD